MSHGSIADQFRRAERIIAHTAKNPVVQARLIQFGYPPERMNECTVLHSTARTAVNQRVAKRSEKSGLGQNSKSAQAKAKTGYRRVRTILKALFPDPDDPRLKALGIHPTESESLADFLDDADTLFQNIKLFPEVEAALAAHGYDEDHLDQEYALVTNLRNVKTAHEAAMVTAENATTHQTTSLGAMNDWVDTFLKIAAVAFEDDPQQLQAFGLLIRNQPTSKTPPATTSTPPVNPPDSAAASTADPTPANTPDTPPAAI